MSIATFERNISVKNDSSEGIANALPASANDIRAGMHRRLPASLQPFLTWLTARPAPGEEARSIALSIGADGDGRPFVLLT